MRDCKLLVFLLALLIVPVFAFAQTGKISGQVRAGDTGDALPGANIVIVGTVLGAAADAEGYYTILNVPPGSYTLQTSFVGYAKMTVTDVRVNINQTTTTDFALKAEAVTGEEVTIVSERPLVEPDVSANVANVTARSVEGLPIAGVDRIITLQAGVEPDLEVRGGAFNQLGYLVDGVSMRDGRDNEPFTNVSLTAFDEVQVQTGGFNAEYGNVRSGIVQVTTKTPSVRYTADFFGRYKPTQDLNFDGNPNDPNAYWVRPYKDPAVKGDGTVASGVWDRYTQRQYPAFEGWNRYEGLTVRDDFGNEVAASPALMEKVFDYHSRKDFSRDPDYDLDLTVGGPLIPGIGRKFGDLRFLASYRNVSEGYLIPQRRDAYGTSTLQLKLTASPNVNMKISALGVISNEKGMAHDAINRVSNSAPIRGGLPNYPWTSLGLVNNLDDHVGRSVVFGRDRFSLTDVDRNIFGGKFTHSLNANSFYEVRVQYNESDYFTRPFRDRDIETVNETIDGYQLNEAPDGYTPVLTTDPGSGLRIGGHWARARDTTNVKVVTANIDFTSQLDRVNQIKAGIEFISNDYNIRVRSEDPILDLNRARQSWHASPIQAAVFLQDKLEFKGMIMNLGLRLDYFNPNQDWWAYDTYDEAFASRNLFTRRTDLGQESTESQFALSPRLGVSFPITDVSKLYFNYGHFRQNLDAISLFEFEEFSDGRLERIGNPNLPFQKTVAYELGYDHSLYDQYLIRISGYYRDLHDQPSLIRFIDLRESTDYDQQTPFNYSDVRGIEVTFSKLSGRWVRGFLTYTYLQTKNGNFGFSQNYENVSRQRDYLRSTNDNFQNRPIAQPFGNLNLEIRVPEDYGQLLGDWRLNFLGEYRSGIHFTWSGPGGASVRGLEQNVQMRDFWNLDMRLSKNFTFLSRRATIFLDVLNALNRRNMYFVPGSPGGGAFEGSSDWDDYMKSLHLDPGVFEGKEVGTYVNIPGSDRPGDFRPVKVNFVPIEVAADKSALDGLIPEFVEPDRRVLGYDASTQTYYELQNGAWVDADQGFVNQVLDDKAYIDMPNETYRTFLNPRAFVLGLRLSL